MSPAANSVAASRRVITVANKKGGTGKTTTSVHLAAALRAKGLRVVLVDADPQGSALKWADVAGSAWTIPIIGMPSRELHSRLGGVLPPDTDGVVIDTPPHDEHQGIVTSALRAATDTVITLAPTTAELSRIGDVLDAVDDVAPLQPQPATVSILLNRVDLRARAGEQFRALLAEDGHHVLTTIVPMRQRFAQAFGLPVDAGGVWGDLVEEILAR
jgi:chromosome partitioning protein